MGQLVNRGIRINHTVKTKMDVAGTFGYSVSRLNRSAAMALLLSDQMLIQPCSTTNASLGGKPSYYKMDVTLQQAFEGSCI